MIKARNRGTHKVDYFLQTKFSSYTTVKDRTFTTCLIIIPNKNRIT